MKNGNVQHENRKNETDVHIEMLANWSENAPKGSIPGGHVPYLKVSLIVINEITYYKVTHFSQYSE